jgi:hypothetical protein
MLPRSWLYGFDDWIQSTWDPDGDIFGAQSTVDLYVGTDAQIMWDWALLESDGHVYTLRFTYEIENGGESFLWTFDYADDFSGGSARAQFRSSRVQAYPSSFPLGLDTDVGAAVEFVGLSNIAPYDFAFFSVVPVIRLESAEYPL